MILGFFKIQNLRIMSNNIFPFSKSKGSIDEMVTFLFNYRVSQEKYSMKMWPQPHSTVFYTRYSSAGYSIL